MISQFRFFIERRNVASTLLDPALAILLALGLAGCGAMSAGSVKQPDDERGEHRAYSHPEWSRIKFAPIDLDQERCVPPATTAIHAAAPPQSTPPNVQRVTVSADTLFKFDRSKQEDMLAPGRARIDRLIESLKTESSIAAIKVTGHADRLGGDDYNLRLSAARAQTVRDYLMARGIHAQQFEAGGKGSAVPLVNCGSRESLESLIECLAPNRRVEIEITLGRTPEAP